MRNKKGVAIAFFALLITSILGLATLVIDVSHAYSIKTKIKNAIDFSTLAGISQLTDQSNVTATKNLALEYLNNNLINTLPSFVPLSLNSDGLSIQVGIYDFNTMTFTENDSISNPNAIKVSLSYNSMPFLGSIFMIENIQINDNSTSVKQVAGRMAPGGGFPLAIQSALLSEAKNNNNMVDLVQAGTANSFFTAFQESSADANTIKQIIEYFENQIVGISPPSLAVGELFQINNGNLTTVYMTLDSSYFEGMTFVLPIVNLEEGFTNQVKVEGFVGVTIDDVHTIGNDYHIAATIIPGYIDNMWSGLSIGAGPGNINPSDQSLLATSFGLVL